MADAAGSVQEGVRRPQIGWQAGWQAAALVALAVWLALRIRWIHGLPAILGTDSYVRMWNRDEIFTGLFGRKWLPLLQVFIKSVYDLGGNADDVQLVTAFLSTGLILAGGFYLYRTAGFVPALLFAVLLSTNFNVMWISASPYQETLFYTFAFLALVRLQRLPESSDAEPFRAALGVFGWIALTMLCRYEGIILSVCAGIAIGVYWWRERGLSSRQHIAFLCLVFAVLPAVSLLLYTGFQDDRHSAITRGIQLEQVRIALVSLWEYLAQPGILFWVALGMVPVIRGGRRGTWPPDCLTAALFVPAFTIVFLILNPFVPVANSRFHVPLALSIFACASTGAPIVAQSLMRDMKPSHGRALTAVFMLVFLAHSVEVWQRTGETMLRRVGNKEREAAVGRVVDARIAPPRPVLFAWERGEFDIHPEMTNMKIGAYLRGSTSRVRFGDDYEALGLDERNRWLAEIGGILVRRADLASGRRNALLRSAAAIHGGEWLATDLPQDITLLTWDALTIGEDRLFPAIPFRVSEALRSSAP